MYCRRSPGLHRRLLYKKASASDENSCRGQQQEAAEKEKDCHGRKKT